MPVVRGDRIGESTKLNLCSIEAQDFYTAFISRVPDDFGRYRHSPSHVFIRMYPRREPTQSMLRRVARFLAEFTTQGLVRTWDVDGVTFGDVVKSRNTGNLFHRTPEPPWSDHTHSKRCGKTATARAREWGQEIPSPIPINEVGATEVEQRSKETGNRGRTEVEHPSHPSHPSPSYGTTETDFRPAAPAGDDGTRPRIEATAAEATAFAIRKLGPAPWSREACDDWIERFGGTAPGGVIGKALKPLVNRHGWSEVRPAWRSYLEQTEAEFASAPRFAATYGRWAGSSAPPARAAPPTIADRNRAAADSFLGKLREGKG